MFTYCQQATLMSFVFRALPTWSDLVDVTSKSVWFREPASWDKFQVDASMVASYPCVALADDPECLHCIRYAG
jgi:hypothetical protein